MFKPYSDDVQDKTDVADAPAARIMVSEQRYSGSAHTQTAASPAVDGTRIEDQPLPPNTFILNKANLPFVEGRSRRLAPKGAGAVALFCVLVLAFISAIAIPKTVAFVSLSTEGTKTSAIITDRYTRVSRSKNSTRTTYYAVFRFRASDGRMYTHTQVVSRETYFRLRPDMEVPVVYIPGNPAFAELGGDYLDRSDVRNAMLAWGVLVLVFLPIMFFALLNFRKTLRLQRHGRILSGTLERATSRISKGNLSLTVIGRFKTPDGKTLNVQDTATRNDLKPKAVILHGTPVAVVYVNETCYRLL